MTWENYHLVAQRSNNVIWSGNFRKFSELGGTNAIRNHTGNIIEGGYFFLTPAGGFSFTPAGGFSFTSAGGFSFTPAGGFSFTPAGGFSITPAGGFLLPLPGAFFYPCGGLFPWNRRTTITVSQIRRIDPHYNTTAVVIY